MKMAKEDLLHVRNRCAEKGFEFTPDEIVEMLNEVTEVVIVDEPGVVTRIKELRNGDQ